jgi:hypothetical protein
VRNRALLLLLCCAAACRTAQPQARLASAVRFAIAQIDPQRTATIVPPSDDKLAYTRQLVGSSWKVEAASEIQERPREQRPRTIRVASATLTEAGATVQLWTPAVFDPPPPGVVSLDCGTGYRLELAGGPGGWHVINQGITVC